MKIKTQHWLFALITTFAAMTVFTNSSFADTSQSNTDENNGQMMQPGMYGGMGPGHMGYGGMGPGNMGYGRMGPGSMGYGHMGPGYMRGGMGYGYGMGMMGHGMMGYGGMGMMQALNLDKNQRSKIRSLMREQRTANCKVMNEMMDVRDQLAAEYDKDQPNAKAIGKLYEKMQGMQRQMIERMVETRNKMRGLLNKEQKQNFDNMYHGGMGMMGGMMGNGMMGYGGMMNMME